MCRTANAIKVLLAQMVICAVPVPWEHTKIPVEAVIVHCAQMPRGLVNPAAQPKIVACRVRQTQPPIRYLCSSRARAPRFLSFCLHPLLCLSRLILSHNWFFHGPLAPTLHFSCFTGHRIREWMPLQSRFRGLCIYGLHALCGRKIQGYSGF